MDEKKTVIAVVGPTATGKTDLGIFLAKTFDGEILSCDSMQIYRGLPVGTAQPTPEERREVPHHLINFLPLEEDFSVSDYVKEAGAVIEKLYVKKKLPVLVGGTGLYSRALLRGFPFEEHCREDNLRETLLKRAEEEGLMSLYEELQKLDPAAALEIHPNNVKRVARAIEYCTLTGELFSDQVKRTKEIERPYHSLLLLLSYHDRGLLYQRIDSRVDRMLEQGLLEEAKLLFDFCASTKRRPTAAQAIGYKELFPYFRGEISLSEAVEQIKRESRRYAKRQITWFSREPEAVPLFLDDYKEELFEKAKKLCKEFLTGKERQREQ